MYDRDRLLDSIDLAELADSLLGPRAGTTRSPTWPCPNPNHAQTGRTPPVTIFRSRAGDERWHCHGCGAGGTAIDLVMSVDHCDVRQALETLGRGSGQRDDLQRAQPARHAHRRPPAPPRPDTVVDPEGLADFVASCARRLWTPEGRPVRRWLTRIRGIPPDVLRHNHIGADPGAVRQRRPDGMPAAGWAAVLPVHRDGEPVFAQLRVLSSRRLRYLNASSDLAPNPRIARYEATDPRGSCVLVTEGIIDALSAAAAGYQSAALLGAAVPQPGERTPAADQIAEPLLSTPGCIVLALDADDAGQRGAARLHELLSSRTDRPVLQLHLPHGVNDLNEWMRQATDWSAELEDSLRVALDTQTTRALTR